jgi:hypothetical protein
VVDAEVEFVKDDRGKVTHLIIHQGGVDAKAAQIAACISSTWLTRTPFAQP